MPSPRCFLFGAGTLLAITFGVYLGVFQNEFVDFDDNIYVTENPSTTAGLTVAGFRYAWTTFDSGNWIPLTWLSYQLDATLFGIRAGAFHATSLSLHVLNVLLLFIWLIRVTGSYWRSFIVAALFGVHPLHVESVAWVAERKDVLSGFWLLVTLLTYERYAARPTVIRYLVTCTAFAMGLLSKSMLVTLPLLLLLADFWPLRRWSGSVPSSGVPCRWPVRTAARLLLEKIPLLLLSLLDGIVTVAAQATGKAVGNQMAGSALSDLPWSMRLGNALQGYHWYVIKTIWPTDLCVYYPHPLNGLQWNDVAWGVLLLGVVSIYVGIFATRRPYLLFGWLWFLVSLLPVIGLVQVGSQAYADRYSYLPQIGLLLLFIWEGHEWLSRWNHGRSAGLFALVVAISALSWLTVSQVSVWRTTDTLWTRAIEVNPANWFAHLQIGNRRLLAGHPDDEAWHHFQIVLDHRPKHAIALNNVGWILQCREHWNDAEAFFRRSLAVDRTSSSAMHNLITVLKKQNRLADGLDLMEAYAEQRPNDATIQYELGMIAARRGQMEAARSRFAQAVQIEPDNGRARNNLALALAQLGRDQEAQAQLEAVLARFPNDSNAHVNLGVLLETRGQLVDARKHFAAALQNNPNDTEARDRLRTIEQRIGIP